MSKVLAYVGERENKRVRHSVRERKPMSCWKSEVSNRANVCMYVYVSVRVSVGVFECVCHACV